MTALTVAAATDYGIEVNGTKVTSDKISFSTGGGTVTYNASLCRLTLNNVVFSRSGSAIKVSQSSNRSSVLKIYFNGTCLLTSTGSDAVVLEEGAELYVNSVTTITTHGSEKYAVHVKNDEDASFYGSGSLLLEASDGYALGGQSGGEEWAYFMINGCTLAGKLGNLVNLGRVQINAVSTNVEMSTSITLEPTSSYYAHAQNVGQWLLQDDVHIDSPLGVTTSDISTSGNYNKRFVINDDRDDPNSGYYSIGNFFYTTVYLNEENATVAKLMCPKKTFKRSQPVRVTVPGFVSINGTYYPTYVNDGALKDMAKTETIVFEYGVIHIGYHAMENCSSLGLIQIPSSARSLSAILYNAGSSRIFLKVLWATLDPTEVSVEDDSFTGSQATERNFFFPTKAASELAQYIPGMGNRRVDAWYACDYVYPDYTCYVVENKATQRTTNGVMTLVGVDRGTTVDNKYSSTPFSAGGNAYYPKRVAPSAFQDNSSIAKVDLTGFEYIGDKAFSGSSVSTLTVGKDVARMGYETFFNCSSLRTVEWNPVFCDIDGNNVFTNSTNITSFSFGNEVATIPAYLCSGLKKITSISIPNSVEYVRRSAFNGCSGLTSISIGNAVKTIEQNAFSGCTGLNSVTIPASTTTIGELAFWNCTGLTSATVGKNVSTMGRLAFGHCTGLTTVNWIASSCGDFGNGTSPFDASNAVSNFNFGSSVTKIPAYLCSGLKSLTTVTIPSSVITIGKYAFLDCSNLNTATIGSSVFTIGEEAFGLCSALRNIHPRMTAPQNLNYGNLVFYGVDKETCILTVPNGTIPKYKATMPWSEFFHIVQENGGILGDLDGNGVLEVNDVVILAELAMGGSGNGVDLTVADLDGSGTIDVNDVVILAGMVMGS